MRTTLRKAVLSLPLLCFAPGGAHADAAPACSDPAWCLTNVTRDRIAGAWSRVSTWQSEEQQRAYYRGTALAALPLDATALKPIASGFRPSAQRFTNIYGHKDILFAIRRASEFLRALFPEIDTLTLLRVDTDFPIAAHPPAGGEEDEHTNGRAADIAYPLSGTGAAGSIDFERTFWLVYAFAKTPGVFEVILDYWDEVAAYGRLAQEQGLITPAELNSVLHIARADKFRNHDTHMHIDVER